jgi:hypothetical protein
VVFACLLLVWSFALSWFKLISVAPFLPPLQWLKRLARGICHSMISSSPSPIDGLIETAKAAVIAL